MMHKTGRHYLKEAEELNITAFMNLMVILVPFLLITAVFSRMTVLQLNLPQKNSKHQDNKQIQLSLELVIKNDGFDIQDANIGLIKHFSRSPGHTDWVKFDQALLAIKQRFPQTKNISLLLEPDVPYKTLIHTMDHVKSMQITQGLSVGTVQLFPDISIGNADISSQTASRQDGKAMSDK